jgi:hypothetical protein
VKDLFDMPVEDLLHKSVTFNRDDPNEALNDIGACHAYWALKHADAKEALDLAESDETMTRAKQQLIHREELATKDVRPTEALISAKCDLDPLCVKAHVATITARAEVERVRAVIDAIKSNRDSLIEFCRNWRAEMERDPQVLERQRSAAAARR